VPAVTFLLGSTGERVQLEIIVTKITQFRHGSG
jgi:hypothetical protein